MTSHEKNQNRWREFCYDLIEAAKADILEDPYQDLIEQGLRVLNWSKPKGEICPKERIKIGSHNKLEPDITLKINERSVFVIEGYHIEFRENDEDEWGYIAFIEPYVRVNHSGTFVTRTKIPFGEGENPNIFEIRYGHFY